MIKIWFVVGWAFAVSTGAPSGDVTIDQTVKKGTETEAIQKPTSFFENLGPAFKSEPECRVWALEHTSIVGRASAGCMSISVEEVRSATK